jgi:hypothetical protein
MTHTNAWAEYCKNLSSSIVEACANTPVSAGPSALSKALSAVLPDWHFRYVLCRGGWYRLGGLITKTGARYSNNLEQWAETELDARDGDFTRLADDFEQEGLIATRLVGRTHYLVAPAGKGSSNFLQLEIEDLQETQSHALFANGEVPSSLEELVDPDHASNGNPIGQPHYVFRRVSHVGTFLDRIRAQVAEPAPIHRMLEDWSASSAGVASEYYNHWILLMREHQDRYQQPIFRAQPIPANDSQPPEFSLPNNTKELPLRDALLAFDRAVGYPMAWFFQMLTTKAVPHWVAQTVVEDALGGFAYLPEKDVEIVRHWLHKPYSV